MTSLFRCLLQAVKTVDLRVSRPAVANPTDMRPCTFGNFTWGRVKLRGSSRADCHEIGMNQYLEGWGGRRESNPQRPEPQSGALPVELLPPSFVIIAIESGERTEADARR